MTNSNTIILNTSALTDEQRRRLRVALLDLQGKAPALCRLPELLAATDPEFIRVRLTYRDRPAGWPEDLPSPGWFGQKETFIKRAHQEGHVDGLSTAFNLARGLESDDGALVTRLMLGLLKELLPAPLYEKI